LPVFVIGDWFMPDGQGHSEGIGERVRAALDSADLDAIAELLDPAVRWGAPDDHAFDCQNRSEVLAWYQRRRDAGTRARVTEVIVRGDQMLVGLRVFGDAAANQAGGEVQRWQVMTLAGERVIDIRGFDDRELAAARAGIPA
jgi:SnoaL-like domain